MRIKWMALFSIALLATPAIAETVTYSYDAQGRLIRIVHSGAVNNGITTGYSLDKAGNRVRATTTGASR